MSLLSEMRDKHAKSITVQLELNLLNDGLLNGIENAINNNIEKYPVKNCTLRFKIFDEAMPMELSSKTYKVNPSDDLLSDIFNLTNVHPILAMSGS
jgi:DNA polymerase-3 subunit alpha